MKTINNYITEKLKIPVKGINGKITILSLFPRNEDELREIIEQEIEENGNECSLNHIDISKIKYMEELFYYSEFNGDISGWDVSKIESMNGMFYGSKFNQDISNWKINPKCDTTNMFKECSILYNFKPYKNGERIK
jgi:hypothetical protein